MSRYADAVHRVQTAIAFMLHQQPRLIDPKHLRVGIDMRAADAAGLAALLIEKGVFTKEEYLEAITASAEAEAERGEADVQHLLGTYAKTI